MIIIQMEPIAACTTLQGTSLLGLAKQAWPLSGHKPDFMTVHLLAMPALSLAEQQHEITF